MLQYNIYKDCNIWLAAGLSIVPASFAESLPLQESK